MEMKDEIKGGHVATDILFSNFLIHYIFLKLRSLVTSIMMLHTFGLGPKPNHQRQYRTNYAAHLLLGIVKVNFSKNNLEIPNEVGGKDIY